MNIEIAGKKLTNRGLITIILFVVLTVALSFKLVNADSEELAPGSNIETGIFKEELLVSILDEDLTAVNILIREGDTAWGIQSKLTPGKDIYELLNQLEELNNQKLEKLHPGDIVKFAK